MILSENEIERRKKLETIIHLVELLQSHRTTNLITQKQYEDGLVNLLPNIVNLEKEIDLKPPHLIAKEILYGAEAAKFKARLKDFEIVMGVGETMEEEKGVFEENA